jgi:hypothetical protein
MRFFARPELLPALVLGRESACILQKDALAKRNFRQALKLNALNFAILSFVTPFAASVLCVLFGVATPLTELWHPLLTLCITVAVFHAWFCLYRRALHASARLFRKVHSWHQQTKTSFALVGSRCSAWK